MNKVFYTRIIVLFMGGIFFFHSCAKDRGKLAHPPFNFHLVEGFESSTTIPPDWSWWNPDNDAKWQVVTTVAHTGHNCMGFNNCSGDGNTDMTGRRDRCNTAMYDFTDAVTVSLSFDVAYAVLNVKNKTYTDSLAVYASGDGGITWKQIYLKGGNDLTNIQTITTAQPCWEPSSSSDWRTDKINAKSLVGLAGHSKVMFAFENRSDWGEWIYLDNVSITASSNAGTSCDGITYAKSIQPIVKSQCAITGCHISGGSAPTDLSGYAGVKSIADDGTLKKRMVDGNSSFMPPTGKLPDSTLGKVQCWLDAGAPNN